MNGVLDIERMQNSNPEGEKKKTTHTYRHSELRRCYRPKRSFGQGNIFTPVCHSVHRGGGSGKENPPARAWRTPPVWRPPPGHGELPQYGETPPDQTPPPLPPGMENPPRPDTTTPPPRHGEPPWTRHPPHGEPTPHPPAMETPPGKQTPSYGLRSAGTHPTGMHSCWVSFNFDIFDDINCKIYKWPSR